ncbi:hypothetical protein FRC02_002580 [Tulasnella sp. 418]|nr:hypothetical protein FRC02_002580 [Tulasnella sp. 418]
MGGEISTCQQGVGGAREEDGFTCWRRDTRNPGSGRGEEAEEGDEDAEGEDEKEEGEGEDLDKTAKVDEEESEQGTPDEDEEDNVADSFLLLKTSKVKPWKNNDG